MSLISGTPRAKCQIQVIDLTSQKEKIIDLLAEQIETRMSVELATAKHRCVKSESAFSGLIDAHTRMLATLGSAKLI